MAQVSTIATSMSEEDRAELDAKLKDPGWSYAAILTSFEDRGRRLNYGVVRRYALRMGFRKESPNRASWLDRKLKPEDRPDYEALLADPRTTRDGAHAWLRERGYDVGVKAVATHRARFTEALASVRHSARLADAITQVARERGPAAISDGMLTRLEQVLMEQLVSAPLMEKIDPKELTELSKSVAGAIGSRETFESMRREFTEAKQRATAVGQAAADAGETGKAVVERMREILGV